MTALSTETQEGGLITISPPAKVKASKLNASPFDQIQVLSHGVDTLDLAINARWKGDHFFDYLDAIKEVAVNEGKPSTVFLDQSVEPYESPFKIYNHGAPGYRWLLANGQYTLKIGNWRAPKKSGRPSIMASIRCETLWMLGLIGAVKQLHKIISNAGAQIVVIKASRVDLCLDMLLHKVIWHEDVTQFAVTRAHKSNKYFNKDNLTGISIGSGKISARLYDKPLEINQQSNHKAWFFDIWGIGQDEIPEGHHIIRVEFQLRRTALKELGIDTFRDLYHKTANLWAYCTQKWLKFRDRPGNHHTMRKTFDWWVEVQNGFAGAQKANPLVRSNAFRAQEKQLFAQAKGMLTSLHAVKSEFKGLRLDRPASIHDVIQSFMEEYQMADLNDDRINEEVLHKRSKYHRFLNPNYHYFKERRS